jgi:hypothetical protein
MMIHGEQIFFKSETLPTFTERGFQPILKTFCSALDELELQPLDTIEGKSIRLLRDGVERPFFTAVFKPYRTEKCEKLTICNCILMDRILTSAVIAIPSDDYDLPMLVLEWSETESVISVVVDYVPLVDLVMHDDYRIHYLDPLDHYWTKYKELPGMAPNRFAWSRMMFSPYYLSGHVPKQDEKNITACLQLMQDYLALWLDLCTKAEPIPDDTRKQYVRARKARIRKIFRENDEGAKSLLQMVGKEIIDVLLLCSF